MYVYILYIIYEYLNALHQVNWFRLACGQFQFMQAYVSFCLSILDFNRTADYTHENCEVYIKHARYFMCQ